MIARPVGCAVRKAPNRWINIINLVILETNGLKIVVKPEP
jgi:hypothetical protein